MSDEHLKVRTVSKALMEMITSRLLPRLVVHKCTQNLIRPNKDLIVISIRVMYVSKHKGRYKKSIPTLLSASCLSLPLPSVGKPIPVVQTPSPSSEDIESLHKVYLQNLAELFEQHKRSYGLADDQHLAFI